MEQAIIMKFEDFEVGQEYQLVKDVLIMGQIDIGQRNAFFQKGLRLIVGSINVGARIVSFAEKNSGVGLDLYPMHLCMQGALHLIGTSRVYGLGDATSDYTDSHRDRNPN
jgi:hypothetical protein